MSLLFCFLFITVPNVIGLVFYLNKVMHDQSAGGAMKLRGQVRSQMKFGNEGQALKQMKTGIRGTNSQPFPVFMPSCLPVKMGWH